MQGQLKQQSQGAHEALSVDSVLDNILEYTSQRCRLRSCSLVSSRWNAAAILVTAGNGVVSASASDALLKWLRRHGTCLRSLTVSRGSFYRHDGYLSMPSLQHLTRLDLKNMTERPSLLGAVGNSLQVCW
jgi:hypothetical protein